MRYSVVCHRPSLMSSSMTCSKVCWNQFLYSNILEMLRYFFSKAGIQDCVLVPLGCVRIPSQLHTILCVHHFVGNSDCTIPKFGAMEFSPEVSAKKQRASMLTRLTKILQSIASKKCAIRNINSLCKMLIHIKFLLLQVGEPYCRLKNITKHMSKWC